MGKESKTKVFWVNDYTQSSPSQLVSSERSKDLLIRSAIKTFPTVTACTIERLGLSGKYANRYVFWNHAAGHWADRRMVLSVEENEVDGVLILSQIENEQISAVERLSRRASKIFKNLTVMHVRPGGFLKPAQGA